MTPYSNPTWSSACDKGYIAIIKAEAAGKEQTVKGYRVKVRYQPVREEEKKVRKRTIAETVLQALRRLKGGSR